MCIRDRVDNGADIPLEQILAGPRRGLLQFEKSEGDRSIGQMVTGDGTDNLPPRVRATGWKAGKTKGWRGLTKGQYVAYQPDASRELSVAFVLRNNTAVGSVEAQSCRSIWSGCAVVHLKEYRKTDAQGSEVVLEPTEEPVKCVIFYRALVKVVELYQDGRMMQGYATALSKGGWTFKIDSEERVRAIASALALHHNLLSTRSEEPRSAGFTLVSGPEGTSRCFDQRETVRVRDEALGLEPRAVAQRLSLIHI